MRDFYEYFPLWHFATKYAAVKFVKARILHHLSYKSRDPNCVGSAMCPESPRKDWRGKSCWLNQRGHRSSRSRWIDYVFDLAWSCLGVELTELSEIAIDREVIRVFLGLLPRDQSRRKGLPNAPAGGRQKGGPQISLRTFVTAYRDTRTKLTKNWFHTFHLSIFIFM